MVRRDVLLGRRNGAPRQRFFNTGILKSNLIDAVALATSHRDRDELDRAIAQMIFDQVQPDCVRVYRVIGDDARQRVQLRVILDDKGLQEGGGPSDPAQLPLISEKPHWHECAVLLDAVHYIPEGESVDRFDSVFPLMGSSGLIGLIEVEFSGERAAMRPHDANLVSGVLRILRNHMSALDYGERDTLTGLLNRRTFENSFAKRRGPPSPQDLDLNAPGKWLGIIDIDRFKTINDTYGHLFGDEVLLLVARLMFDTFRSTELVYRFGGEEFVVILDNTTEEGAGIAFGRYREAVAAFRFPQIGQVTVSVGFTRSMPGDVPATAMERADRALYYAKEHGRNSCCCYEALLREGKINEQAKSSTELELF